jgi:ribosomal protein S18 acetylase RimI-like enzyme
MKPMLEVTSEPSQTDVDLLENNLEKSVVGCETPRNKQELCVFMRDEAEKMIGGLRGITVWGWLQIKNLWVAEDFRGLDLGTEMIRKAEEEAIGRGCIGSVVDTFDFQAAGFYEKMGYTTFGVQEGFPTGHKRIYLQKRLRA